MTYVDDGVEGEAHEIWWAGSVRGRVIFAYTSFAHHYPSDDLRGRSRREQASSTCYAEPLHWEAPAQGWEWIHPITYPTTLGFGLVDRVYEANSRTRERNRALILPNWFVVALATGADIVLVNLIVAARLALECG